MKKSKNFVKNALHWCTNKKWLLTGILFGVSSIFFCIYALVTKDFDVLVGVPLQTLAGLSLIVREF